MAYDVKDFSHIKGARCAVISKRVLGSRRRGICADRRVRRHPRCRFEIFIDPLLLRETTEPALRPAGDRVRDTFADIIRLLKASRREQDVFWNKATVLMPAGELSGLCIGYSTKSTGGRGIGPVARAKIFHTVKEIIQAGIEDPAIFDLVGMFEKNVGADGISDLLGHLSTPEIIAYTKEVLQNLATEVEITEFRLANDNVAYLARNPFSGQPVLLLPKSILRDLPIAEDWSDIDRVTTENEQVRERFRKVIGPSWRVVELKLTTNQQLVHGCRTQVREYAKAERTKLMHYVVLDVDGGSEKRIENLDLEMRLSGQLNDSNPEVAFINARSRPAASKA